MHKSSISEMNVLIGKNIRLERKLAGRSQSDIGEAIGVTFQQIQKYERGSNSISGARLAMLSSFLNVPVSNFYMQKHERPLHEQVDMDADTLQLLRIISVLPTEKKRALAVVISA